MTHIPMEIALHCQEYFDNEHLPYLVLKLFYVKFKKMQGIKSGSFFRKKIAKKKWKRDV